MTVAEKLQEKVAHLSPERQQEVLDFVEFIESKTPTRQPLRDPEGLFADIASNLTFEEIKEARREGWKNAPRELPG